MGIATFFRTFFSLNTEPTPMIADIKELPTGEFALISRNGLEATYTRRRDAVRGATRRGFVVA